MTSHRYASIALALIALVTLACDCQQMPGWVGPTAISSATPTPTPTPTVTPTPTPTPAPIAPVCLKPIIVLFAPDSSVVTQAHPGTYLRWETQGAVSVTLEGSGGHPSGWELLASGPLTGSFPVGPAQTRSYRLTAVNACGQAVQIVTVRR